VREAAESGMVVAEIIEPLLNMTATVLANAVVENQLDAAEEIENVHRALEELYEQYLAAYCRQPTA
jgi:flagellin-specific chaperone FliS